ncbi:MAG: hypothetical protein FJ272_21255, partial [Planctomycetes bacterium]|nr:hypothetical protein [Planctomycetota bacterium]
MSGCVSKGAGGEALVETVPDEVVVPAGGEVHDVTVEGCQLRGQEVHPTHRTVLYRFGQALVVGQTSRRIRVLNNATEGSIVLRVTTRSEIVNNRIHGGGVAAAAYETIMDRNILTDAPSRILFYPRRHSYVRFNEMHGFSRFSWNNASESYLVHGGSVKTVGSPTGASANTLVDAKQAWKPGHYKDATVVITSGRGFGQYRWVLGNTENTLTLEQPWRVMPDATSEYVVGMFHTDSAFYGNLNEGCGTLHLWLDCIGIVVERHRASLSGGTDVWGRDVTSVNEQGVADKLGYFHPAWYNMFLNNWLDGSFMRMVSGDRADNAYLGPVLFANYAVANTIRQPHMRKHAFVNPYEEQAIAAGGVKVGNQHPWLPTTTRGGTSHSVVVGNFVSYTAAGVVVTERARKTFVLNNDFQEVDKPVLDRGARTVMKGNRQFISDEKGDYHQPLPDAIGERDLGPRTPPKYAPAEAGKRGPLSAAAEKLRPFIASVAYVDADIRSLAKRDECQKRLNELFLLLKKHGAALPRAAFYPEKPASDPNSLQV